MSVNKEIVPIPQEVALALCKEIREENANIFWSVIAWQCWDCMKSATDDPSKMGFSRVPGNRGCRWVNWRYSQMVAQNSSEDKPATDLATCLAA